MRRTLLAILFSYGTFTDAFPQSFGNEWINFQQDYFKFSVIDDGCYRLTYNTLLNSGIPVNTITGSSFQIFNKGKEIPIYVTTDGAFQSSDYIEFYAVHNDGTTDSNLYFNKTWQANERLSMFDDTAFYFLTWNSQPNHIRFINVPNNISNHPPKELYCWYTSAMTLGGARAGSNYGIGPTTLQGQAVYLSDFSETEGYTDVAFNKTFKDYILSTPHFYTSGPGAIFRTHTDEYGLTNHLLSISVNGNLLSTISNYGYTTQKISVPLPVNSWINSSATTITYSSAASTEVSDYNSVAWLELKYPHEFNFDQASSVLFNVSGGGSNKYIEISNFNSLQTSPVLYDFTNHLRMEAVVRNDTEKFLLPPSVVERELLLVANDTIATIKKVSALTEVHFTDFSNPINQGNFIIITHPFFFDDGSGHNYVNDYRDFKNSTGYHSIIIDVHQLYDQFAYGIQFHPLAIRNFADYILAKWTPEERHFFLIGKGIEYYYLWPGAAYRYLCYVPTFGYPGSDMLLTATNASLVPRISIGRISCLTADELRIYLDKVKLFAGAQSDPFQTLENKAWTKNVIHLAGGTNATDQAVFQYYLDKYKRTIEDTLYGGHVFSFFKSSTEPVQYVTSAYVDSILKSGVSLMTFFGHSSYNSFDFNLDKPDQYDNYGKYPFMLTNGCLIGNLFSATHGISENFIFEEGKAAIGFLAPSQFSISSSLDLYSDNFYRELSYKNYERPVGTVIAGTIKDILAAPASPLDKAVAEQMLLDCDPSLKINTHPKPDYVIEPQSIIFDPPTVSAGLDSFHLKIVITNIGKAIADSFYVDVHRKLPDGEDQFLYHYREKAPYFTDTLSLVVKNQSTTALGMNQFDIKIDAGDGASTSGDIDEISELNNEVNATLLILADDIVPVYPYEFSIVNASGVVLKASTVNPFAAVRQYVFQIDTTENFNSPQLRTVKISQKGGVVKWVPPVTMQDSMVYYWRTSLDTLYHNHYSWHTSSFTYIQGSSPGWSQSRYFQFLKDSYANIQLSSNRVFNFVSDIKTVGVYDGVTSFIGGPLTLDQPAYYLNGVLLGRWGCGGYGTSVLFAVIDSLTGLPLLNPNVNGIYGLYHSIQCSASPRYYFYFNTQSPYNEDLVHFLDSIPRGDYILMMTMNDADIQNWNADMKSAFTKLGLTKINTIHSIVPYVFFLKKNDPRYPVYEVVGDTFTSIIDTNFAIRGSWDEGYVQTPLIGPSASWSSLHWKTHGLEKGTDHITMQLIGVNNAGNETTLFNNIHATDTSIATIDAHTYPFIKLQCNTLDTNKRTPVQIDDWRINYQPVPEAALNPSAFLSLMDTAQAFIAQQFSVAVENLSPWKMDSMLMNYQVTDIHNVKHSFNKRYKPLAANDTIHASYSFDTGCDCYAGLDYLYVEANPNADQPEQTHFNNTGILTYQVSTDKTNPLLDVTFDGIHILDNDLVSAKPDIEIMLKDESKFLALNDTSLFDCSLIYPDGSKHLVNFDNQTAFFYPADPNHLVKNNTARVSLHPSFSMDGKYELMVQGYDRSGNASGDNFYKISFEVINKAMISNVMNYPNPFSTSTRFVFTLTGSVTPQQMKIEIMTITGKIVKEIFLNQLGNLHIGANITDYAWDGTDQYGDKLANGLYFYRVNAILDGKPLDHYGDNTDEYFKKGIGKMYLMR